MRSRLKRLQRAARGDLDWLQLRDGGRYHFAPMAAHSFVFSERMDAYLGLAGKAPLGDRNPTFAGLRDALASATPGSLARFESRYGPAEPEAGAAHRDGSVTLRRVHLDGSVEIRRVEGEEAEHFNRRAGLGQTQGPC